jgi:predicted double-glycine peptidase
MKEDIIKEQEKLRIFKVTDLAHVETLKKDYKLPIEVRTEKLRDQDGFKIFLVDGYKIRQFVDLDFTMGGHGYRYVYVPFDEVWIDDSNKSEIPEVIIHETYEANLMKNRIDYGRAHEQASLVELELRNKKITLPVGNFRQPNEWSCGPSALKIILDYFKENKDIDFLIKEIKCDETGTLHFGFTETLRKLGYEYFEKKDSKIEDIENFLKKGLPIIVDYQDHEGGHFSVIIGMDEKRFMLSDPALDEKSKWINKQEFEEKWWEEDEPGETVKKWMLVIYPKNF